MHHASKGLPNNMSTDDLLILAGHYLADGSIGSGEVLISMGKNNKSNMKDNIERITTKWGLNLRKAKLKGNKINYVITSTLLADILQSMIGCGAHNKRVPPEFLNLNDDQIKTFLTACFEGDGCLHDRKNQISYTTTSKQVQSMFKLLLFRLGIIPTIKYNAKRQSYALNINTHNQKSFSHAINGAVKELKGCYHQDKDNIYLKIKSITKTKYCGPVHNFEVEDDNSYVTESFAVHNCMLEVMACGTPVISNEYSSPKELIGNNERGFLVKAERWVYVNKGIGHKLPDVDDAVIQLDKAYKLWQKGELKSKFSKKCIDFAKQYDWDIICKEWKKLIEEVVSDGK